MAKETQARAAEAGALTGLDEFSDILKQTIKPRTDIAAKEVDNAVVALVREALDDIGRLGAGQRLLRTVDDIPGKRDGEGADALAFDADLRTDHCKANAIEEDRCRSATNRAGGLNVRLNEPSRFNQVLDQQADRRFGQASFFGQFGSGLTRNTLNGSHQRHAVDFAHQSLVAGNRHSVGCPEIIS